MLTCPYTHCPNWRGDRPNRCDVYMDGADLKALCWDRGLPFSYLCTLCHRVFRARRRLYYLQGRAPICHRCARKVGKEAVARRVEGNGAV